MRWTKIPVYYLGGFCFDKTIEHMYKVTRKETKRWQKFLRLKL